MTCKGMLYMYISVDWALDLNSHWEFNTNKHSISMHKR